MTVYTVASEKTLSNQYILSYYLWYGQYEKNKTVILCSSSPHHLPSFFRSFILVQPHYYLPFVSPGQDPFCSCNNLHDNSRYTLHFLLTTESSIYRTFQQRTERGCRGPQFGQRSASPSAPPCAHGALFDLREYIIISLDYILS